MSEAIKPKGKPELVLETSRLVMRPLGAEHLNDLVRIYSDEEVARYIGGAALDEPGTRAQLEKFAAEWGKRGVGQSAVFEKSSARMIGRIGLHYWDLWDELEIGYVLESGAQGKGYAAEGAGCWLDWAVENLETEYLTAVIHPDNAPSAKVAGRLGFEFSRRDLTPSAVAVDIYRKNLR
ncbi:RimJ/RimL family protein N-acetyltransferase [Psychromicrobium silvestre]|uniref:RimJ/RimL family protein N-acetyltransferase n=1 Tax=Psychromicrobium silvestre TaxID=1645614 RepID=A0A7Y9LRU8_9MICC|nr:GNAT family N-acetyltransferase [Psychromicrobium silvestre]NYE94449.1 RimJ/RimL family protein N-acetyltransferase [Psychromicrobium silvestre]